jgi:hypothetical protein
MPHTVQFLILFVAAFSSVSDALAEPRALQARSGVTHEQKEFSCRYPGDRLLHRNVHADAEHW